MDTQQQEKKEQQDTPAALFTNPARKLGTSRLKRGWNESEADFIPRLKKLGFAPLEEGTYHWSPDHREIHPGSAECKNCITPETNAKVISKNIKEDTWVEVYNRTPKGYYPVLFIGYDMETYHMTCIYTAGHKGQFEVIIKKVFPLLPQSVEVKLEKEAPIDQSTLYPNAKFYSCRLKMDRKLRALFSRFNMADWIPHLTDQNHKLKIGDKFMGKLFLRINYVPLERTATMINAHERYLGLSVEKDQIETQPNREAGTDQGKRDGNDDKSGKSDIATQLPEMSKEDKTKPL